MYLQVYSIIALDGVIRLWYHKYVLHLGWPYYEAYVTWVSLLQ